MPRKPVKRAVWVRQPRKDRIALQERFGVIERSRDAVALHRILSSDSQSIKPRDLKDFMLSHQGETKSVLRRMALDNDYRHILDKIKEPKFLENFVESGAFREDSMRTVVKEVADNLGKKEIPKLTDRARKALDKYIRGRNIPYNRKVFEEAVDRHLNSSVSLQSLLRGEVNPRGFESLYLATLKDFRGKELSLKTLNNFLLGRAFPKDRITSNRRSAAEKWLRKNFVRLASVYAGDALLRRSSFGGVFIPLHGRDLTSFADFVMVEMKRELGGMFSQTERARQLPLKGVTQRISDKKLGSRDARMAEYRKQQEAEQEPREEAVLKGVVTAAKNAKIAAELEGKPFDAFEYVLKNDNRPEIAQRFRQTVIEGLLHRQDVIRLYSKGDLATRVFFGALDSGFLNSFVIKDVYYLADFICSLGAWKKDISTVLSGPKAEKRKAIFHFLENRKLIGTHHSGGDVVMLRRPASPR